jgi:hypothetical protein
MATGPFGGISGKQGGYDNSLLGLQALQKTAVTAQQLQDIVLQQQCHLMATQTQPNLSHLLQQVTRVLLTNFGVNIHAVLHLQVLST